MDWQTKMNTAVNYIEENISGEITFESVAKIMGCSVWEAQRMFSFVTDTTLGEYIRGRKLTLAAKELQNDNEKIIDIAIKYGYESSAAFSRAFSRRFGMSPSQARTERELPNPCPKITFQTTNNEGVGIVKEKNDMQA